MPLSAGGFEGGLPWLRIMEAILNHIKPLLEVLQVVFKDNKIDFALARLETVAGKVMLGQDLIESLDSQLSTRIWARNGGDDDELLGKNSRAGFNHLLRAAYFFEKESELEKPRPLGFIKQALAKVPEFFDLTLKKAQFLVTLRDHVKPTSHGCFTWPHRDDLYLAIQVDAELRDVLDALDAVADEVAKDSSSSFFSAFL